MTMDSSKLSFHLLMVFDSHFAIRKDQGKLVFTQFRTCTLQNRITTGDSDSERALKVVLVSEEVKEALSHDFRIVEIVEVWHFEQNSEK